MIKTIYLKGTKSAILKDLQLLDKSIKDLNKSEYPNIGNVGFGHYIGKVVVEPATIDNKGNVTKEAIMSEDYHFNLWLYEDRIKVLSSFKTQIIEPPKNPVNKLANGNIQ